ncbi:pyrethroid hydrolase Ces2a isoform X2 [Neodiprion fabricii]|uniref:pyrethroid hydrolase Ces2a isoform X2 n=1 Tax=Neodiprion fabricii TaxID=2872261 RepID=UPI001ED959DB|nr:pyrethroid hydrolase Ces2a isoform X2 [Neodiprion fabricii]
MHKHQCSVILLTIIIVIAEYTAGDRLSPLLKRRKRIVGGIEAAQPPEDDPVVFVSRNERDARIYGTRDEGKGFYVFRGIRFGEPPVGRHRFQRPRRVNLEGDLNATKWGAPCPQPDSSKEGGVIGSEDCLFLNVFTPALPDEGDGYPVLVWIHGGGFRRGAACQYEMRNLIKKKMVVVSIQYRLGSLGFLSTGSKELPGNNGMFDMTLAVDWIKDYIEFFGGNPRKIVAFGQGTGASAAMMLSLSKLTQSHFSGLIAMSGSVLSHFAIDKDPTTSAKAIAMANDCPVEDVSEMTRCLQELPLEKLIDADSSLESIRASVQGFVGGLAGVLGPGPVVEGQDDQRSLPNFMTKPPEGSLDLGEFPEIPLLIGVMKDETGGAISGRFREEIQEKVDMIPNFVDKNLVETLQGTIPSFGNAENQWQFVPEAFSKYLNIPDGTRDEGNLFSKVAKATGDALFNAPAFLAAEQWSKKGKAFLYSFDHTNGKNFGKGFLQGLPLAEAKENDGVASHGDDLGYIFGRNSIIGERLTDGGTSAEPVDPEDAEVTDVFTEMIANFARSGELSVPSAKPGFPGGNLTKIPSFTGGKDPAKTNPFVSVTSKPRLVENFRYCEMGLWTGSLERIQSSTCGLFKASVERVEKVGQKALGAVMKIGQETFGVGSKVAEDVVRPEKIASDVEDTVRKIVKPPAVIGGAIRGLIPGSGISESPSSQSERVQHRPLRPSQPKFGSLIPRRGFMIG